MADMEHTCENCKWEHEDMDGKHCRHCIHNAEEHFEPKDEEIDIAKIRAKVIDEFAEKLSKYLDVENATKYGNTNAEQQRKSYYTLMKYEIADAIEDIAEQMNEGRESD